MTGQYRVGKRDVIQRWFARQRIDTGKLVAWNTFDETPPLHLCEPSLNGQLGGGEPAEATRTLAPLSPGCPAE